MTSKKINLTRLWTFDWKLTKHLQFLVYFASQVCFLPFLKWKKWKDSIAFWQGVPFGILLIRISGFVPINKIKVDSSSFEICWGTLKILRKWSTLKFLIRKYIIIYISTQTHKYILMYIYVYTFITMAVLKRSLITSVVYKINWIWKESQQY